MKRSAALGLRLPVISATAAAASSGERCYYYGMDDIDDANATDAV